jgi:hypothetical protein
VKELPAAVTVRTWLRNTLNSVSLLPLHIGSRQCMCSSVWGSVGLKGKKRGYRVCSSGYAATDTS